MADEEKSDGKIRKQEEDFTPQVDEALPKAVAQATGGDLRGACDSLLPLEKKARIASDAHSTGRILEAIVQITFDANDFDMLGEYVILLTKRRGALKLAVTKMVQKACVCLEKAPDMETTLKLIDTLRTVTAGKIHVEIERARLTSKLAKIKEADGDIAGAAKVLQELQVETYGSMDRKEKIEFILEQMRLSLANNDHIRTAILSKKISARAFEKVEFADLKIRYYNIVIDVAMHEKKYLDVCKYYRQIFDTPSIQEDDAKCAEILKATVVFLALSPYDNEQSDLVARVAAEKKLKDVPEFKALLQSFITQEIMPWTKVEAGAGPMLKGSGFFDAATEVGKARFDDLRRRVVEHNIRVMSKYYTYIQMSRLSALLELPEEQVETFLSDLVVSKTVYAKIDRPKGVVSFCKTRSPDSVLQDWSSEATKLMGHVDRATHLIEKELVNVTK